MENLGESVKYLCSAFEYLRALHGTLEALMVDVAALRQVVLKEDKAARHYRKVLAEAVKEARPLVATAMQAYDTEIARIKTAGTWKN
jgi:hypothetical protein